MTPSSVDNVLVVIPARLGSTRLSNKLLRKINQWTVIRHTVHQVSQCKLVNKVIVATDNALIAAEVVDHASEVVITQHLYTCGTDRCASIIGDYPAYDVIINVQGDQPDIDPAIIDRLAAYMVDHPGDEICTLMSEAICDVPDQNIVKVSVDAEDHAISFSRTLQDLQTYQHIGVYGFRRSALIAMSQLPPTSNERAHRLEQLRWLDHGQQIKLIKVAPTPLSIDVATDLEKAQNQSPT